MQGTQCQTVSPWSQRDVSFFPMMSLEPGLAHGEGHMERISLCENGLESAAKAAIILLGCSFTSFKSDVHTSPKTAAAGHSGLTLLRSPFQAYVRLPASVCMMLSNLRMMAGLPRFAIASARLSRAPNWRGGRGGPALPSADGTR